VKRSNPKGIVANALNQSIAQIKKEFWKELRTIGLAQLIVSVIKKGISPVMGAKARFQKYSQSYLDQIMGKSYFFKRKGKIIRVDAPPRKPFEKGMGLGKKRSPVSLHLTGKMLSTLSFRYKSGTLVATDVKWDYHNGEDDERADNMPERRLLPNRSGESFNRLIQNKITDALAKATGRKTREVKRLIKVSFKFK
jgi:hypothetical protein